MTKNNKALISSEQDAQQWVEHYRKTQDQLTAAHAYHPSQEHENCGVGLVAATDGKPTRLVVETAVQALKAVWHRGAVDADGKTGDGAGIMMNIPQAFFRSEVERTGHIVPEGASVGVGMVFLPRTDMAKQEACRVIIEREILNAGYRIHGWRQVPVEPAVLGMKANATRPEIEQILIHVDAEADIEATERSFYIIRRRIENAARAKGIAELYICSLSINCVIYKGMFLAQDLSEFYPDLLDPRFVSNVALYHQRYSTNTFPTWSLAQPFRVIAHNGEINTLKGNHNWMRAHESRMELDSVFGDAIEELRPVIQPGSSDTSAMDAVFELLCSGQRALPMVKSLMIPEAWSDDATMPDAHKALYQYCNSVMEPWDGPAAVVGHYGSWVIAGLDRSGLRPMRYSIVRDRQNDSELLIAGSETGMVRIDEQDVIKLGRIGPGSLIAVNLAEGKLYMDAEIKDLLAGEQPFADWTQGIKRLDERLQAARTPGVVSETSEFEGEELRRRQLVYGATHEELELILHPMIVDGKEPIGSMGDDTPMAVLSDKYRPLHHFFRQDFSQVTNPPIDSLRERSVMSLTTRLGNLGNILDVSAGQCDLYLLASPVLTNGEWQGVKDALVADGAEIAEIDCTYDPSEGPSAMRDTITRIRGDAERAARRGIQHLFLSDKAIGAERAPMPMILATGAVHTHLLETDLRTFVSLNVQSGECMDTHYFAVLIGVGATSVNAYMVQENAADRIRRGLVPDGTTLDVAMGRFKKAIGDGILKIMSKMGIGVVSSYRGGYNFEAVGLSRTLVSEFFPGVPSRISGIGLIGIQKKLNELHAKAYDQAAVPLPIGGFYRFRRGEEKHAWDARNMHLLQSAVNKGSFQTYKQYAKMVNEQSPIWLRDLLGFKTEGLRAIDLSEVESVTSLRKRFVTPGISLGALSKEAHETLAIAMNRIGARSDSGEGGEDPDRYHPWAGGDNAKSAIKQVASGRFGVTAEYLNNCAELEIKMAQGAKPGEGGQLPGFKVSKYIAKMRHSTPGVTLISPPPHHDIYSIEDLAQLIYDLKQINPEARVCVKLVARSGIGTIAAGVAKADADVILVSGNSGGTGASPQTSIKYAGLPWEMGLAEVHQVLTMNELRSKVTLRTDGGLRTGLDIVKAAMLGAEEFGIGTAALVAMGCIMVRQCHSNTCPVGVCTQDEALREKFSGTAQKVIDLFSFVADEVREILAELGFSRLEDVIGRTDLLTQISRGADHLDDLDLNAVLQKVEPAQGKLALSDRELRNPVPDTLDAEIIKDAKPLLSVGEKMELKYNVANTQRTVGTRLSSEITRKYGMNYFDDGHVNIRLRGSAGQSLGAFACKGMRIEVTGDSNDYVGKGLSGGIIVVRPSYQSPVQTVTQDHTIIGNTVLYGATSGKLFAAGQAGERFCVRNSGATAVVEGCGGNGCEYMTGGVAVILGETGKNFGAGMTGGMAFVYDPEDRFQHLYNPASLQVMRVTMPHYQDQLKALVAQHHEETRSVHAERLLVDWERCVKAMWQVVPTEMLALLDEPVSPEHAAQREAASA